jgi:uncharacterized protein YdgA (DUF945 family)
METLPPKVHNFLKTESKDTEKVEMLKNPKSSLKINNFKDDSEKHRNEVKK